MANLEIIETETKDGVSTIAARRVIESPDEEGAIVLGRTERDGVQALSQILTGGDLMHLSRRHAAILTIDGGQYVRALDGSIRVSGEVVVELYRLDEGCSVQLFSVGSIDGYLTRPRIPVIDPYQTASNTQDDIHRIMETDRAILDRLDAIETSIARLERSDSRQNQILKQSLVVVGFGILVLVGMKIVPIDLVNSIGQLLGLVLGIISVAMGFAGSKSTSRSKKS